MRFANQNPKLKILMVAPTSFFGDYGGHIRILEETLALQALGHQVTIVTYFKGNDVAGLDIRRTAALPWHTQYEVGSSRHKLAFDLYLAVRALRVGLAARPDIIHGHMHEGALIGGLVAHWLGVPLIFDYQGSLTGEMVDHGFLNPQGQLYPWARQLERFIDRRLPQAILTSSLRARHSLENDFGVRPERISPLPDCVDLNRFCPDHFSTEAKTALREQLGVPAGRPIVAYLGLLASYQGTGHLIEAAAHLKQAGEDVHFLIMGYPGVDGYRAMARDLGVAERVTLTGRVPYAEAPCYLSLGDVAVSPKVSVTEGSGKVLNYMAMAQPIVAYDTSVHREYLGDLGVYAPAGDVAALATRIAELAHDPERRHCLGQQLRQRAAANYSWQRAAGEIVRIYRACLGTKRKLAS
ncbi:MAG: glycosyltransferase family 4 protein [Chloroflexota bacterium]